MIYLYYYYTVCILLVVLLLYASYGQATKQNETTSLHRFMLTKNHPLALLQSTHTGRVQYYCYYP